MSTTMTNVQIPSYQGNPKFQNPKLELGTWSFIGILELGNWDLRTGGESWLV